MLPPITSRFVVAAKNLFINFYTANLLESCNLDFGPFETIFSGWGIS